MTEEKSSIDDRLVRAFRLVLGRKPAVAEIGALKRAYENELARFKESPEAASKLLDVGESKRDKSIEPIELAAWTSVGNVLLNLNETITK